MKQTAFQVAGNSMEPLALDGDFVIVREDIEPENDDIVVVAWGPRHLVKQLKIVDGEPQLHSINKSFGPIIIPSMRIIGVATLVLRTCSSMLYNPN